MFVNCNANIFFLKISLLNSVADLENFVIVKVINTGC